MKSILTMKATGVVLYLNFNILITMNFSHFEMLYYEKFVTSMTFLKERLKIWKLMKMLSYPIFKASPFHCFVTQTDILSLVEITPRLAYWF